MLAGHANTGMTVTTKFDGSPAVVLGVNPDNGKFFVGTKAVFNKTPKLFYTEEEVEASSEKAYLKKVFKLLLQYGPELHITNVLQGDVMFTRSDLGESVMDGEKVLTFTPNTITYAVPLASPLAKTMQRAEIGVVFHTTYTGDSLKALKASYGFNSSQLDPSKDIWVRDARFMDTSGDATLDKDEMTKINAPMVAAVEIYRSLLLDTSTVNYIAQSDVYKAQIQQFINSLVRAGKSLGNSRELAAELQLWVAEKLNASILDAKMVTTRTKRLQEKTTILNFYRANLPQIVYIFEFMHYITVAKSVILGKLAKVKSIGTFMKTDDGYKVTAPEGFVAIDHVGNAVKLVDRLTFSHNNFNTAKNWDE